MGGLIVKLLGSGVLLRLDLSCWLCFSWGLDICGRLGLSSGLSFNGLLSNLSCLNSSSYFFDLLWCCLGNDFLFWWDFLGNDSGRLSRLWFSNGDFLDLGWLLNLGRNGLSSWLDFLFLLNYRGLFYWYGLNSLLLCSWLLLGCHFRLLVLNWWCLGLDSNWLLFGWRGLWDCLSHWNWLGCLDLLSNVALTTCMDGDCYGDFLWH